MDHGSGRGLRQPDRVQPPFPADYVGLRGFGRASRSAAMSAGERFGIEGSVGVRTLVSGWFLDWYHGALGIECRSGNAGPRIGFSTPLRSPVAGRSIDQQQSVSMRYDRGAGLRYNPSLQTIFHSASDLYGSRGYRLDVPSLAVLNTLHRTLNSHLV